MVSLIIIALMLLYFYSGAHDKVLEHFGLTDRDNKLMWMGFMINLAFSCIMVLIVGLIAGNFSLINLFFLVLACFFIYRDYRSL